MFDGQWPQTVASCSTERDSVLTDLQRIRTKTSFCRGFGPPLPFLKNARIKTRFDVFVCFQLIHLQGSQPITEYRGHQGHPKLAAHTHTHMRPADKGRNSNKAMYETHERSTCLGIRNTLFSFTHLDPEPRLHLRAPGLPGHHRATALRRCQRALRAVNGTAPEAGAGGGQWHGAGPLEGPGPDRCVPTW